MNSVDRRQFMAGIIATGAHSLAGASLAEAGVAASSSAVVAEAGTVTPIDFRYAPLVQQTAFCFPDDPYKSIVGELGDLRYGWLTDPYLDYTGYFSRVVQFSLQGAPDEKVVRQELESPGIPIVETTIERANVRYKLTTFATRHPSEGRVDNVLMEVLSLEAKETQVAPLIIVHSVEAFKVETADFSVRLSLREGGGLVMLARSFSAAGQTKASAEIKRGVQSSLLSLGHGTATKTTPARAFFRFPLEGQSAEKLHSGLGRPDELLSEARSFWQRWTPFQKPVNWTVSGRYGEFLTASARNILQVREMRDNKLTFEVGPTEYRNLFVVDGHFILEAARYLGYDKEAEAGLRTTWSKQNADGAIFAGAGTKHWKDTAIAMFSLVRQCELAQDWKLLDELTPNVVRGIAFLDSIRVRALSDGSFNGKYGLLAPGFGDGGLGGANDSGLNATSNELANTLWTLAGLKAIANVATPARPALAPAAELYTKLYQALRRAAAAQMLAYPSAGFDFLPMLLKEDAQWAEPDPWLRPRLQTGQWALSHTIYPGLVFPPDDPIVLGHARLMQECAREEIPAETGWARHEAVWTYNAPFVSEVYLWLGKSEEAEAMFRGFLNHATSLYCWREEQPLRQSSLGEYVGDMPHNWASAECIRFLRHSLALEDGTELRLLAGITADILADEQGWVLTGTPTRFGRVNLALEPLSGKKGWRLTYERSAGPAPATLTLPERLGRFTLEPGSGAKPSRRSGHVNVAPETRKLTLTWR